MIRGASGKVIQGSWAITRVKKIDLMFDTHAKECAESLKITVKERERETVAIFEWTQSGQDLWTHLVTPSCGSMSKRDTGNLIPIDCFLRPDGVEIPGLPWAIMEQLSLSPKLAVVYEAIVRHCQIVLRKD
jgi:hypothetical protein